MLRGPDGEIVWECWDSRGLERCLVVLLEYQSLRYKMPAYSYRTGLKKRVQYARVQVHRMGKGADASYMHPAASKIRKFMLT